MGWLGDIKDAVVDTAASGANWVADTASDGADWVADNAGSIPVSPFGLSGLATGLLHNTLSDVATQVSDGDGVLQRVADSPWLNPNSDSLVVNLVRAGTGQAPSSSFVERVIEEGPEEIAALANSADEINRFLNPAAGFANSAIEVFRSDDKLGEIQNQANGFVEDRISFAQGVGDWVVGAGELTIGVSALSNPVQALALERTTGINVYEEAGNAMLGLGEGLLSDPDAVASAVVGYDKLKDDPIRWLGEQAPDIALEIATAGAGAVGKLDDIADAGMDLRRALPDADDVPIGVDDLRARMDAEDGLMARREKDGASRIGDPEGIRNVMDDLEAAGVDLRTDADPEIRELMDNRARAMGFDDPADVEAITYGDIVLVREEFASDPKVLGEELEHVRQNADGRAAEMTEVELEIDAREHVIANAERYRLNEQDIATLQSEIDRMRETGRY